MARSTRRRLVAAALAGLVGLGLTACGDEAGTTGSDGAGSSVETPATAEPARRFTAGLAG